MDEISVMMNKFGDDQSTLLDQFERLSFEVHLNQAILARSLSAPSVGRTSSTFQARLLHNCSKKGLPAAAPTKVKHGKLVGFNKVLKKLLKPILCRKGPKQVHLQVPDPKNHKSWKALSRSLKV
ncbi:hypothetical protein M5689_009568 [Euphorbia peplus]|nr:hypothetical protein M5689_009568 [Euphorbia peplus]